MAGSHFYFSFSFSIYFCARTILPGCFRLPVCPRMARDEAGSSVREFSFALLACRAGKGKAEDFSPAYFVEALAGYIARAERRLLLLAERRLGVIAG